MGFFKAIAVGIGWLTSSLAGISAVFYACGFLINRVQSNLLGIDIIIQLNHEQFVQEGGKFFLSLGIELGNIVFDLFLVVSILMVIIMLLLKLICFFRKQTILNFWVEQKERLQNVFQKHQKGFKVVTYSFLLCLLLISSEDPYSLDDPLEISNLLYVNNKTSEYQKPVENIYQLLEQGDAQKLSNYFSNNLIAWLKVVILLMIIWRVTSTFKYRFLAVSPFIIIVALHTLLLPMLYGVLKKPIKYPIIKIHLKDDVRGEIKHKSFLLSKTNSEFIIWDSINKKLLWLPVKGVKSAELFQLELLFNPIKKNISKDKTKDKL